MTVSADVQGIERQKLDQFTEKAEQEVERQPAQGSLSSQANPTMSRDDYHRIPYFI